MLFLLASLLAVACGGEDRDPEALPKLTVSGDSVSVGLGAALRDLAGDAAEVKVIGQNGTGLARPDLFDWPARLEELARDFPPDVLFFSVGSNDTQALTDPAGGVVVGTGDTEGWDAEYRSRLARAFDAFEETATTVVWVGHVRAADPTVADTNRRIHALAVEEADRRGWVEVEDLAELTGSGDDEVSQCLADGLHLTLECYDEAAAGLLATYGPD